MGKTTSNMKPYDDDPYEIDEMAREAFRNMPTLEQIEEADSTELPAVKKKARRKPKAEVPNTKSSSPTVQIPIYIPKETAKKFKLISNVRNTSMSKLMVSMIDDYVRKNYDGVVKSILSGDLE